MAQKRGERAHAFARAERTFSPDYAADTMCVCVREYRQRIELDFPVGANPRIEISPLRKVVLLQSPRDPLISGIILTTVSMAGIKSGFLSEEYGLGDVSRSPVSLLIFDGGLQLQRFASRLNCVLCSAKATRERERERATHTRPNNASGARDVVKSFRGIYKRRESRLVLESADITPKKY